MLSRRGMLAGLGGLAGMRGAWAGALSSINGRILQVLPGDPFLCDLRTSAELGFLLGLADLLAHFVGEQGPKVRLHTVDAARLSEQDWSEADLLAVLGPLFSFEVLNAVRVLEGGVPGVPVLLPTATAAGLTALSPQLFQVCVSDPVQGKKMAGFAAQFRRVVVLEGASSYSQSVSEAFQEDFPRRGVRVYGYAPHQQDFAELLSVALRHRPEAIFIPGLFSDVVQIAKQARELGFGGVFLGTDGWDSGILLGEPVLEGSFFCNHFAGDAPEAAIFKTAFEARFEMPPDAVAALCFDVGRVLSEGLLALGPQRVNAAFYERLEEFFMGTGFSGTTGPMKFGGDRTMIRGLPLLQIQSRQAVFSQML